MALDELHARRLATVISLVEGALDRIELLLQGIEKDAQDPDHVAPLSPDQIEAVRGEIGEVRRRLARGIKHFGVHPQKPGARQALSAELSTLWVILENALPSRLKGYGREFATQDKNDWEKLIQELLNNVESVRTIVRTQDD